jgi:hypothetical protein
MFLIIYQSTGHGFHSYVKQPEEETLWDLYFEPMFQTEIVGVLYNDSSLCPWAEIYLSSVLV